MAEKVLKPRPLRPGDKVRVIAPSSPFDKALFMKGIGKLSAMGLSVAFRRDIFQSNAYLAGSDARRLNELHDAFDDKECRAIFCARGGFGSSRLLEKIDFGLIRKNPKIFMGFSDITSFHLAFYKKAKLITFHGPMIASRAFVDQGRKYDKGLLDALFSSTSLRYRNISGVNVLAPGRAEGILLGGNMTLIHSMIGTGYLPDFKGKILFLEDIAEAPYKIDRMLSHMFSIGLFDDIRGAVFGRFMNDRGKPMLKENKILKDLIKGFFGPLKIPVLFNFPVSHGVDNVVLPIGSKVSIYSGKKELICEAGVSGKK